MGKSSTTNHIDQGTSFRITQANSADVEDFDSWNAPKLAMFLKNAGLGDYSEMFLNHRITGRLAPLLQDADLKEMGVLIIGDRLRLKSLIVSLCKANRYKSRAEVLWTGEERLYFNDYEKVFCTCFGLCPDDPSTYKLTNNHLRVKTVNPWRCGPIRCCCCLEYSINNIDISKIDDVDVMGTPAPCLSRIFCCAPGKDIVDIKTSSDDGRVMLALRGGDGERVSLLIMNQVEEAQIMERS